MYKKWLIHPSIPCRVPAWKGFFFCISYCMKNMDCVAIETLRTQILYTLLRDLVATYKKEPTNTEKIEYIKRHIMTVSGKSEKNYNDSKN